MTFNKHRLRLELQVVTAVVDEALKRGWAVSVFDGEETTVEQSKDREAIIAALRTTDEDQLTFHTDDSMTRAWVRLIYGNLPWEVVNDYSVSLEDFMQPIDKLCETLEAEA
jgi:hypothetical protein